MDGVGRAIDNVFIERLWRTVKYDHVYLNPANSGNELRAGLSVFLNYYNELCRSRHNSFYVEPLIMPRTRRMISNQAGTTL